jgi:hypothetical protein
MANSWKSFFRDIIGGMAKGAGEAGGAALVGLI